MKYLTLKVGTKFVSLDENGNVKLTKKPDLVWPVDMEQMVLEGMDKLKDQGLNVRVVLIDATQEPGSLEVTQNAQT